MSTATVTPQIEGLPPGAIVRSVQPQAQDIEGLPAGAVVRPVGANTPSATDPNAWRGQFSAEELQHLDNPSFLDRVKRVIPGTLPYNMEVAQEQTQHPSGAPGSFEGHPENVGEYVPATAGRAVEGAVDMSRGNVAMGAHKEFQAFNNLFAPMAPFAVAAAPGLMARAAVGGYLGGKVASGTASLLGASDDQSQLAGDVGSFAGGTYGAKPGLSKMFFAAGKNPPAVPAPTAVRPTLALPSGPTELPPSSLFNTESPSIQTPGKIITRGPDGKMKTFFTSGSVEEGTPAVQYQTPQAKVAQARGQNLQPPPYATFGRPMNGQSAAMQSLPGNMDDLLSISHQRGLPIPENATAQDLLHGIVDSLTEPELAEFEAQSAYRSRFPRTVGTPPSSSPVQSVQPAANPPAIVGTIQGAANDTALFQQARQQLGPDASISDVALLAQKLKTQPQSSGPGLMANAQRRAVPSDPTSASSANLSSLRSELAKSTDPAEKASIQQAIDRETAIQSGLRPPALTPQAITENLPAPQLFPQVEQIGLFDGPTQPEAAGANANDNLIRLLEQSIQQAQARRGPGLTRK